MSGKKGMPTPPPPPPPPGKGKPPTPKPKTPQPEKDDEGSPAGTTKVVTMCCQSSGQTHSRAVLPAQQGRVPCWPRCDVVLPAQHEMVPGSSIQLQASPSGVVNATTKVLWCGHCELSMKVLTAPLPLGRCTTVLLALHGCYVPQRQGSFMKVLLQLPAAKHGVLCYTDGGTQCCCNRLLRSTGCCAAGWDAWQQHSAAGSSW